GDGADAGFADQLDADASARVDLFQIVDELRQIFDRIDVVMRRRRYQGDADDGVSQGGDFSGHLVAGELAAFTRLGALGDFDLQFVGGHQVFGSYAKARRGDLLDATIGELARGIGIEAGGVLAAFAAVAARAQAIHGDGDGFVGLAR